MEPIVLSIQGQPPRKSNNRRVVRNRKTGKRLVIKSRKALDWLEAAAWQIPAEIKRRVGGPDQPLHIVFYVRYETRHPDLSTELIMDMLQETDVIRDDRYVYEKVEHKIIDGEDPGVDIVITGTRERNLTREQCQVLAYEFAKVPHVLVEMRGPHEDGSVGTHWSDGEWFTILANGETTGYSYDHEGLRDDDSGPPLMQGEANTGARLTEEDVKQIRLLYDAGEHSASDLADMFGVHPTTIDKVGKQRSSKQVPEEEDV